MKEISRKSMWFRGALVVGLVVGAAALGVVLQPAASAGDRGAARSEVEAALDGWSGKPREVAETMVKEYGKPDGITPTMLVWEKKGPWKRIIVYKEEVPHHFPKPHTDIVEQFIDYRVPADRYDELAKFDGSVIAERTKGELSARCDNEAMNFLALNLAHEVATGKLDVEEARNRYGEEALAFMNGKGSRYVQALLFSTTGPTADRDVPLKMMEGKEKATEKHDMEKEKAY